MNAKLRVYIPLIDEFEMLFMMKLSKMAHSFDGSNSRWHLMIMEKPLPYFDLIYFDVPKVLNCPFAIIASVEQSASHSSMLKLS